MPLFVKLEGAVSDVLTDWSTSAEETTRTYVSRLEAMVDEERLPSGDDLISAVATLDLDGGRARGSRVALGHLRGRRSLARRRRAPRAA